MPAGRPGDDGGTGGDTDAVSGASTAGEPSAAPDETAGGDSEEAAGDDPEEERRPGGRPLPPGPPGLPLLGNTLQVVRDPWGFYDELATYGDVVQYEVARRRFVALLHPDHVQQVLLEDNDRFERYLGADLGLDFASEGLLFARGEQWRRQRHRIQPAFTVERIESYADAMAKSAADTADGWRDGEEVVLDRAFSSLTLEILAATLFDVDVDPDADEEPIVRGARAINDLAGPSRNLTALLPDWVPTPANRRYQRAMADYRARVEDLIDTRRASGESGDDLLSLLLEAGGEDGGLSAAEIRDNLITFTFAGHETTAGGLTYAVMLVAAHDDVGRRLRAELDDVLGDERPGFADVPDLAYTEQVLTEAMRRYPPAPVLFRRVTEDATLGGYRLPEGSIATLPQFHLHNDERFYDDPETFDPDRWTDDLEATLPEYAYFPFGGGPRHCIGMRFATLEMTLVLATLAQRYEFELLSDPDPDLRAGVTLTPADPVRVRVRRR